MQVQSFRLISTTQPIGTKVVDSVRSMLRKEYFGEGPSTEKSRRKAWMQYSVTKAEPECGAYWSDLYKVSNTHAGQEYQVLNGVQQGVVALMETAQIKSGDTIYIHPKSPHIELAQHHASRLGATLTHDPKPGFKLALITHKEDTALTAPTEDNPYLPAQIFSQDPENTRFDTSHEASRVDFPTIQIRELGPKALGTTIMLGNNEVISVVEKLMTFRMICPPPASQRVVMAWMQELAIQPPEQDVRLNPSATPELLELAPNPIRAVIGLIEGYVEQHQAPPFLFASGYPSEKTFPMDRFAEVTRTRLSSQEYLLSTPQDCQRGRADFLAHQVGYLNKCKVNVAPEQALTVNGGQEALGLLSQILVKGHKIAVDQRTYGPCIGNLRLDGHPESDDQETMEASKDGIIKIKGKDGNIDVADLEAQLLAHKVAGKPIEYLYVIPKGHNPNGGTLSKADAQKLVALAKQYGFTIIEDNPYGDIVYVDEPDSYHYLKEFDPTNEHVILLESVSKKLAAGLRRCTIVGPEDQMKPLQEARPFYTAHNPFMDSVTLGILDGFDLPTHVTQATEVYRECLTPLMATLREAFPDANIPDVKAGMFIKLDISHLFEGKKRADGDPLNTIDILKIALDTDQLELPKGVAFIPLPPNELRLAISQMEPSDIQDAVTALRTAVNKYLESAKTVSV